MALTNSSKCSSGLAARRSPLAARRSPGEWNDFLDIFIDDEGLIARIKAKSPRRMVSAPWLHPWPAAAFQRCNNLVCYFLIKVCFHLQISSASGPHGTEGEARAGERGIPSQDRKARGGAGSRRQPGPPPSASTSSLDGVGQGPSFSRGNGGRRPSDDRLRVRDSHRMAEMTDSGRRRADYGPTGETHSTRKSSGFEHNSCRGHRPQTVKCRLTVSA
jgi:hypothetical protein